MGRSRGGRCAVRGDRRSLDREAPLPRTDAPPLVAGPATSTSPASGAPARDGCGGDARTTRPHGASTGYPPPATPREGWRRGPDPPGVAETRRCDSRVVQVAVGGLTKWPPRVLGPGEELSLSRDVEVVASSAKRAPQVLELGDPGLTRWSEVSGATGARHDDAKWHSRKWSIDRRLIPLLAAAKTTGRPCGPGDDGPPALGGALAVVAPTLNALGGALAPRGGRESAAASGGNRPI